LRLKYLALVVLVVFSVMGISDDAYSAESTDNPSTLPITVNSFPAPVLSFDSDGYAIVTGEIENVGKTPLTNIKIQVDFYDNFGANPLEITSMYISDYNFLPNEKNTFSIRSQTPNPNITSTIISILGFEEILQDAFADHTEVTIVPATGSGAPGCETTFSGCYTPSTATVDVGGVVIFSNTDSAAHTFTSGEVADADSVGAIFDSSLAMAGTSFEWSPTEAGEVPYFCIVHPWMTGLIIVSGESTISHPDVFVTQEMPITPTNSNDLTNQIINLKNDIIFLENEIDDLQDEVFQLNVENKRLYNHNNNLQGKLDNLQNIINEQIKVIMDVLTEIKNG